jgi:ribosome maturation factor RimP
VQSLGPPADCGGTRRIWRIVDYWLSGSARPLADDRTTQDEELAVATGLPSQKQVIELLDGEFARAGYEIEDVAIDERARPPRITVVADGDTALDLDTIARLSRSASELLDGLDVRYPYVLEVSSPGVERPLTTEKHFRRARGRKVEVSLADGSQLSGRIGELDGSVLRLVTRGRKDWSVRELALGEIVKAVVQVEFSPPSAQELELAGQSGAEAGA